VKMMGKKEIRCKLCGRIFDYKRLFQHLFWIHGDWLKKYLPIKHGISEYELFKNYYEEV